MIQPNDGRVRGRDIRSSPLRSGGRRPDNTGEPPKDGMARRDFTSKDYIDRSMDAVRAHNDARFAEMLSEIKSVHVDMNARLSMISADIHSLTLTTQNSLEASREAKQAANAAESVSRGAADLARTHNWNILMAMIAVVAVILALGGLWMTAMQTVRSLTG